jgi:hypothetical protein
MKINYLVTGRVSNPVATPSSICDWGPQRFIQTQDLYSQEQTTLRVTPNLTTEWRQVTLRRGQHPAFYYSIHLTVTMVTNAPATQLVA